MSHRLPMLVPTPTWLILLHQQPLEEEWEEDEYDACDTDGYPLGRSLEQVMEHCEEIDKYLDDPNYGIPIEVLDAEIDKMIAEWR